MKISPACIYGNLSKIAFCQGRYKIYTDFDRTLSPIKTTELISGEDKQKLENAQNAFVRMAELLDKYKDRLSMTITTGRAAPELKRMYDLYGTRGITLPSGDSIIIKCGGEELLSDRSRCNFPYNIRNRERTGVILQKANFSKKAAEQNAIMLAGAMGMEPAFAISTLPAERYAQYSFFFNPDALKPKTIIIRDIGATRVFLGFGPGLKKKTVDEFTKRFLESLDRDKMKYYIEVIQKDPECGNLRTLAVGPIVNGRQLGKDYDIRRSLNRARQKGNTVIVAGDSPNDYEMLNPFTYLEKLPADCDRMNLKKMMKLVKKDSELEEELRTLPLVSIVSQKPEGNEKFLDELFSLLGPHTQYAKVYACKEGCLADKIEEIIEK